MLRAVDPHGSAEVWRDQTSCVSIAEVTLDPAWIGRRVQALEESTGARVAYLMRFGLGTLPTPSMALQDGDQVFMLLTDDISEQVTRIAGTAPDGSQ
jgi:trk system potassium uptake protein TrkA